jgi:NitT/TauT family transport system permease protein
MAVDATRSQETIAGLDALDLADKAGNGRSRGARLWAGTWPKLLAIGIFVAFWQVLYWTQWRPAYVLPSPTDWLTALGERAQTAEFQRGVYVTIRRGVIGFAIATVIGVLVGVAVARIRILRAAIGSMITALQTMPSIAWFPLAILLFQLTESAIQFVIILGAAPSIANGVIAGVDYVPPLLLRAGRNIGARGVALYRYVIAPASLPHIVAGLKQGWAFAWRSLMAGELLVLIPNTPSLGAQMQFARDFSDAPGVIAIMSAIFAIGIAVDLVFTAADRAVRRRWGLLGG